MEEYSEITINDIWPKLCELGIIELHLNNRTVWSDGIMDVMVDRDDYDDLAMDYLKRAEKKLLEDYTNFRVTNINIKIDLGHHCIVDVTGYYEHDDEEEE